MLFRTGWGLHILRSCFAHYRNRKSTAAYQMAFFNTKAVRSKRKIARRMGSSGSLSSPSLSLSRLVLISDQQDFPTAATPRNADNIDGEDSRTITTSDNKILRFLFQKKLKNSDVSSLGRIVLPKKDADAHLLNLTVKERIQIGVGDVSSNAVCCKRYRCWPNNYSSMYVLECTGDFMKQNSWRLDHGVLGG
ncbi:B3 domain-containing transcription factor LEC2-like isoform X2 [Macadamia integrifolia]|uniref:B3 domain-containing transcription factor LEC2-like isoform X2 n=1 Tax=Macadamia integrifolia TaxID=60698 RepID=UPI001C52CCC8|nr:B3 domain-containing transcription factor LEC2-like isoform X2 [Macadamia integrifolia]XP_042520508.1 B3 domain-containing transcription factor LEC2-like isoform X2 [Macadamia integrifolia]XP_042520509.1 B3 domain-containing transcription factor LEC2-like isoform X2 [Macadamia integrifolia]